MVAAQARMETLLLLRNGEHLLLAVAIPLLVLVGGHEAGDLLDLGPGTRIDVLTPGVFALSILSTAFASVAIATGFERRYGVLKRLGASPLPRSGLIAGKVAAVLIVQAGQLVLVSATAFGLGWQPRGGAAAVPAVLVLLILGTAALVALGLLLSGTLRAEATLATANLVFLLLLAGGGVVVPLERYPEGVRPLLELTPTGALAEGLREALGGAPFDLRHAVVLLGWALLAGAGTARTFQWE